MDRLPNELLMMILELLDESDINFCPRVCKNWKNVAYNGVGVFRAVGPTGLEGFVGMGAAGEFEMVADVKEIERTGIRSCVLMHIGNNEVPEFMKQFMLKRLTLHGPISQTNFKKLVTPLENLQKLTLNLTSLSSFRFEQENEFMEFSKLKHLKIVGVEGWFDRNLPNDPVLSYNILKILLDTKFPQLNNLQLINLPVLHFHEESDSFLQVLKAITIFMVSHSSTLRKFVFVKNLSFVLFADGPKRLVQDITLTNQLQLHSFELYYLRWNCFRHEFDSIIESQSSLRHYMSAAWNPSFSPRLVTQNSATLVTLELFFKVDPATTVMADMVIDCVVFVECYALKSLTLVARNFTNECGQIIGTKFIPKTLKSVRFLGFLLSTTDANDLVTKEWDMLKKLELQYVGTSADFGVPFHGLCQLFDLKRVENVFILGGVNIDSLSIAETIWWKSFPQLAVSFLWSIDHENPDTILELRFRLDGEGTDKNYVNGHGDSYIPTNHMSVITVTMHEGKVRNVLVAHP